MDIKINSTINFQRRLRPKEEGEYSSVLNQAKEKIGNSGKSILIVPTSSLPQDAQNNTGVGSLNQRESAKFFNFAKQYWGINEIQIQPTGQYHNHKGQYPIYSGTSMELGNHMIDIKSHCTKEEFNEIVKANGNKNVINYSNIVDEMSKQEEILKRVYEREKNNIEFTDFKAQNSKRLEPKALYRVLREINHTHDYKEWNEVDKKLYSLPQAERDKRIAEIYKQKNKEIDFYKFKQFLAEKDLKNAKEKLNQKGLKLDGDMLCGFSYDEVWSHPKAFLQNKSLKWDLPALDLDSTDAEKLLREKVNFYAKHFDGLRIDASWVYVKPLNKDYGDKYLNLIDDEIKKVKGNDFDLKNIMHEFVASAEDFNIYDGEKLKPYVDNRVKIYTSDWLSENWGSNKNFLERGWKGENFIIGVTNHDSKPIKYDEKQAEELSKILGIPLKKLKDEKEFVKAKFAEPMMAYNNMLYFKDALANPTDKISSNFENDYFKALEEGKGFNPMDALEKTFKAKGLDREEPELFRKIVKYRKILESKKGAHKKIITISFGLGVLISAGLVVLNKKFSHNSV